MKRNLKMNKNKDGSIEIVKTEIERIDKTDIERRYIRLRDMIMGIDKQINNLKDEKEDLKAQLNEIKVLIEGESELL